MTRTLSPAAFRGVCRRNADGFDQAWAFWYGIGELGFWQVEVGGVRVGFVVGFFFLFFSFFLVFLDARGSGGVWGWGGGWEREKTCLMIS